MQFLVLSNGEALGAFTPQRTFSSMGMTSGPFTPYPSYERVARIFRLFTDASVLDDAEMLHQYYAERDRLHLSVVTETGIPVPVNVVHIVDLEDEEGRDYEVQINVPHTVFTDERYWFPATQ